MKDTPVSLLETSTEIVRKEGIATKIDGVLEALTSDFALDNIYRSAHLSMTASENYPSKFVRALGGGMQGGFYEFAPPYVADAGEWYFPDSGAQASLVHKLSQLGCQMFEASTFDWRPNGGSAAEQAILLGCCQRGDAFVHFSHQDGGHFALEALAHKVGIEVFHCPVDQRSLLIDVDRLRSLVKEQPHIRLVILDQSFKLRWQPLLQLRAALPDSVVLSYDASHDGGLIIGEELPQPLLLGADIVHGNTHKTIPGPQKGYVAFRDADHPALHPVSNWICPQLQSNSHAELIAPMYAALTEMALFGRPYAQQIRRNARALAHTLHEEGLLISGESFGFTETHQVHVVIGSAKEALDLVTGPLAAGGIRCNNIEIPGSNGRHGLRLGVQALTRRGIRETEMAEIARLIVRLVLKKDSPATIRGEIALLLEGYPIETLQYSLDGHYYTPVGMRLMEEVLR